MPISNNKLMFSEMNPIITSRTRTESEQVMMPIEEAVNPDSGDGYINGPSRPQKRRQDNVVMRDFQDLVNRKQESLSRDNSPND